MASRDDENGVSASEKVEPEAGPRQKYYCCPPSKETNGTYHTMHCENNGTAKTWSYVNCFWGELPAETAASNPERVKEYEHHLHDRKIIELARKLRPAIFDGLNAEFSDDEWNVIERGMAYFAELALQRVGAPSPVTAENEEARRREILAICKFFTPEAAIEFLADALIKQERFGSPSPVVSQHEHDILKM